MRKDIVLACFLLAYESAAFAQGFFLPAGDKRLREDLTLLVDEGVINLPLNEWPLARRDVEEALRPVDGSNMHDIALQRALARVRAVVAVPEGSSSWRIREISVTGGEPGLLRHDGTLGRENGELIVRGGTSGDRFSVSLTATTVVDPVDGREFRFDGSDISAQWGNWIFSVNQMDRWW